MESMRRSLDRSRQPGLKKPRLAEDQPNPSGGSNPFVRRPPPTAAAAAAASSRFRAAGDRDSGSNDTVRGGDAYHPQPLHQNQVQELVNQYKTALAELTFNSKPIITNLTIIAGENVSAAKAIAATVCNHIIEVPSEQKLPSLYLLDSIVKNIGRDYAKHFAPRLPEVFGKAYRQVDPPIQSSMRHLFGTWKNVFPVQCLQTIGEELGFSSATNGSSSGTVTSRSDAQSQRPQHSIHVNPKYLERQQRLQQSGRAPTVDSPEDINRPERISSIVTSRAWTDSAVKLHDIQRSQRITPSPIQEKNIGQLYGDLEYETDTSRNSGLGSGLTGTRATEQGHGKPWYGEAEFVPRKLSDPRLGFSMKQGGADHLIPKATKVIHQQPTESVARRSDNNISTGWKNSEEEAEIVPRKLSDPRLGFSRKRGVADHLIPKSTKAVHIQPTESIAHRSDNDISNSWKNSEEEEFMWDMHSRLPDQDVANLSDDSRKDPWIPSDPEKLGFENRVRRPRIAHEVGSGFDRESSSDSLSTEQRERLSYGNRLPSPWRLQDASSVDELLFSGSTTKPSYAEAIKASSGGFPSVTNSVSSIAAGPRASSPHDVASGFGVPAATSSQQRFPSVRAASPPHNSSLHPAPSSASLPLRYLPRQLPNAADQDSSQVLPQSHQKVHQFSRSLLPQNVPSGNVNKFQSEDLQSSSVVASVQQDRQYSIPRDQQLDFGLSESFGPCQKQNPILDCNAGAPSTSGSSGLDQSIQHTRGTSGESSTSSLLAAVMKSGILSNITTGGLAKKSLQDSGQVTSKSSTKSLPPATQVKSFGPQSISTSSIRPVLRDSKSYTSKVAQKEKQQQLPLGLPASLKQTSKTAETESNPISNLLSSLLVKGLIKSEVSSASSCQVTPEPENLTISAVNPKTAPVSSLSKLISTAGEKSLAKPDANSSSNFPKSNPVILKPDTKDCVNMPQSVSVKTECLLGLKFKSNLVREFHPDVIDSLFDGLPHQCNVCGFRLKDKERLDKHLQWHNERQADLDVRTATRRWYVKTEDWISPKVNIPPAVDSSHVNALQNVTDGNACQNVMDLDDAMTPADEDQCVCVLCGELFEDYYSPERNKWMFRGAVRMNIASGYGKQGKMDDSSLNGPLVHLQCRSEGSASELGLSNSVKMEE